MLEWFVSPSSSEPRFVITLHYDPWVALYSIVHSFIDLYKPLYHNKVVICMRKISFYITAFYPYCHNPVRQVGSYQLELENGRWRRQIKKAEKEDTELAFPHEHIKNTPTCGKILTEI